MSQRPSRFDVSSVNGAQIVDVTISRRWFAFGQSRAKVSVPLPPIMYGTASHIGRKNYPVCVHYTG